MHNVLRKSLVIGFSVVGLSLSGPFSPGDSAPPSQSQTLNFLTYTGVAPKDTFNNVKPTGWIGGQDLIFIDTPGTASNPNSACGAVYLSTYGCPSTLAIAGGYNEVEADGNPAFETGFGTIVTGLTPGQTYDLELLSSGQPTEGLYRGHDRAVDRRVGHQHHAVRAHRHEYSVRFVSAILHVFERGSERKHRGNTTHEHAVRRPDGLEFRYCPPDSGRFDRVSEFPGVG